MEPNHIPHAAPDSWFKRMFASRIVRLGVVIFVITVAPFLASWFREYTRSQAIKQRLTGTWKDDGTRADGSSHSWIWEFRADGTVRNYPVGKPPQETGRLDDYFQWEISRGELVLSWDHQFTREASIGQRFRQVVEYLDVGWRKKKRFLAYSDRCLIQDLGGELITLTPHSFGPRSDGTFVGGYVTRPITLIRAQGAP